MTLHSPRLFSLSMLLRAWATFAGLFFPLVAGLRAQSSDDLAPGGFFARSWTVNEGLSHNQVNRLVQDRRGYLWAATAAGLVRFDGIRFKEFPLPGAAAESRYNVRTLVADPSSGALVMLPASGGVVQLQGNIFGSHPANVGRADKTFVGLFCEPSGALWVATGDRQIMRWQQGRRETVSSVPTSSSIGHFSFALDGRGETWIAFGDALGRFRDGQLTWLRERVGSNLHIAPARSGGFWLSTSERLMKWDNEKFSEISVLSDWPAFERSAVQQLFEDRQGRLWIGTHRKGLFCLTDAGMTSIPLAAVDITSILQDTEENIWIGTNGGGITRLQPKIFVTLDRSKGLSDDMSTSICEDAAGGLWCANRSGGLVRYKAGQVQPFPCRGEGPSPFVNVVCLDRRGQVWAGADSDVFVVSSSKSAELVRVPGGPKAVHAMFGSSNGDVWVAGAENSLGYFHEGVYVDCTAIESHPRRRVVAVTEDTGGRLWIATGSRDLFEFVAGKFVQRFAETQVPGGGLNDLVIDARGDFWLATTKGLVRKHGDQFTRFGTAEGISDEIISQILVDDRRQLWCANRRGFSVLAIADLEAIAAGRRSRLTEVMLGREEGLAKGAALAGVNPMASKARDGRLWFATYGGLVGVDPTALPPSLPAPPVYFDEIEIDGRTYDGSSQVRLGPGDHKLSFKFAAVSFSAPEKVHMRHQLIGFDEDWVSTGSERSAEYVHLRPGNYRLRVAARHQNGPWSESGVGFAFVISPAWWQRWSIRLAGGIASAGVFAGLVAFWSQRRLRERLERLERERQLERERARIARDLHDEIGASVTQIGLIAHRLKNDSTSEAEHRRELGELATRARRLSSELEGIVWTVSPKNDRWDRLASFVRQFALDYFVDMAVVCSVEGVDMAPSVLVAPEVQNHVLAIVKEAVNNILKHARANRVKLVLAFTAEALDLTISDDGVGFNPFAAEHTERNGLLNMRARAEEVGGTLEIVGAPGKGTDLKLFLPLNAKLRPRRAAVFNHHDHGRDH